MLRLVHNALHLGAELPHLPVVRNDIALLGAPLQEVLLEDALCKVLYGSLYVPAAVLVQLVRHVLYHYLSQCFVQVQRVNHAVHGQFQQFSILQVHLQLRTLSQFPCQ